MQIVIIDLSSFSPEEQSKYKKKILSLAWDDYIITGHPEILSVAWNYPTPIEALFPELAPYLIYQ